MLEMKLFEHIKIQTNNTCTRKCAFCYFGQKEYKPKNIQLDDNVVYKLLDELADLNYTGRVGLFETNEPLTDKRIFKFLKYAKEKLSQAQHMLISNGDLLNKDIATKLFQSGLDRLLISAYDDSILKKGLALKISFPEIEILDRRDGKLLDNRGGNVDYKYAIKPLEVIQDDCERVHKMLYVKPSAKVVSCISDFYEVNIMGDVRQESLLDIWNGEKFWKLRKELANHNRSMNQLCRSCNYPGSAWFFND